MEKEKQNRLYMILGVVICLICVGIGYVIAGRTTEKTNNNGHKNNSNNEEEITEEKIKPIVDTFDAFVFGYPISSKCEEAFVVNIANYNGEVYVSISLNETISGLQSMLDEFYQQGTYTNAIQTINSYTTHKNGFKGLKLDVLNVSKIVYIGSTQTCANSHGLVLIKEDGTVSAISYYSLLNGKTNVTNISSLTNIVDVKLQASCSDPRCGNSFYAIDKDGNSFSIGDYISLFEQSSYKEW